MDSVRFAVEPLEGYAGPEEHVRLWVNGEDFLALHPGSVGGDPAEVFAQGGGAAFMRGGDVVVRRCYCMDEDCGFSVATVLRAGDRVEWALAEHYFDDGWQSEFVATYEFDAVEYDAALEPLLSARGDVAD